MSGLIMAIIINQGEIKAANKGDFTAYFSIFLLWLHRPGGALCPKTMPIKGDREQRDDACLHIIQVSRRGRTLFSAILKAMHR